MLGADALKITQQVDKVIGERFKDRNLIEYEVTDRIITRVTTWAKIGAWVFAPAAFLGTLIFGAFAFFGIKTYSDATAAIKKTSETAVAGLHQQTKQTEETLLDYTRKVEDRLQIAEQRIESALRESASSSTHRIDQQNRKANELVLAVMRSAQENQDKLTKLSLIRSQTPDLPIGSVKASELKPSSVPGMSIDPRTNSIVPSPRPIPFDSDLSVGSRGEDISQIQRKLKEFGCYKGIVSGQYDTATEAAVRKFQLATEKVLPVGISRLPKLGVVDYTTWSNLFFNLSPLGVPHCAE